MRFELILPTPPVSARLDRDDVASLLARLIASGTARSKAEIVRATGLSRTTVDTGMRALFGLDAVRFAGLESQTGRGRPAELLELTPSFGVVLVADCGYTFAQLAVFDLGQNLLVRRRLELHIEQGPEIALRTIVAEFAEMLADVDAVELNRTLIVGLPGPVDYHAGTLVRPPIMQDWDGYPVRAELEQALSCTTVLENDVNLRAIGEARAIPPSRGPVLCIKIGTGIGVGIVATDGTLVRGADGSAGDVGHIRVAGDKTPCVCGGRGCLEAVASIRSIGLELGIEGVSEAALIQEVVDRVRRRDPATLAIVKQRSHYIGEVLVSLIHFINPERIVVSGALALASDDLLATVRSEVYKHALPLATRSLTVSRPALGDRSGLAGGLALGIEASLEASALASRNAAMTAERSANVRVESSFKPSLQPGLAGRH